ncbi:inositol hexakisphosphate kinase 1-like isoform X1 [Branchiostoma floridae]|uniref:Kinase n=1 Tax=Branchiostoma floridae TaxID=7739 RepID=A0A9J7N1P8_BRAFL|nr:inositol hexakisphosphate kinase 1-like isoform X1 [Branchiostoma floridae]
MCLDEPCAEEERPRSKSMEDYECLDVDYSRAVPLEPFIHQVGGHSSMMRFDEHTVCKPMISREHHFYLSLPKNLRKFSPEYRGVIQVSFQEDKDGFIRLVAHPCETNHSGGHSESDSSPAGSAEEDNVSSASSVHRTKRRRRRKEKETGINTNEITHSVPLCDCVLSNGRRRWSWPPVRVRLLRTGSIEVQSNGTGPFLVDLVENKEEAESLKGLGHNPWSLRCHKKQLAEMRKTAPNSKLHKFILLENVTSQFVYPCILDLKMGTRQHGDDATEEKRNRQMEKCASTTSASIGVRVCGMQVYKAETGHFLCRNKYYGRKLTEDGFKHTLQQFLDNGQDVVAPKIIAQLQELKSILEKHQTYRFYSSSLLIIYEGNNCWGGANRVENEDLCASHRAAGVAVKMIDFAHSTYKGFRGDRTVHQGPDKGYIFGLENLLRVFHEIVEERGIVDEHDT